MFLLQREFITECDILHINSLVSYTAIYMQEKDTVKS